MFATKITPRAVVAAVALAFGSAAFAWTAVPGAMSAQSSAVRLASTHTGEPKSPWDGLGGIGGAGTNRGAEIGLFATASGDKKTESPWDGLGGIGGAGTNRSGESHQLAGFSGDKKTGSPWDGLGGIGGAGTNRSAETGLVATAFGDNKTGSPWDGLGGIGGQGTARGGALRIAA